MSNAPKVPEPALLPPARLVASPATPKAIPAIDFSEEKVALLKLSAGCKDLFDDEFQLFVEMCRRRRLDPFCRQVYAIVRTSKESGRRSVTWQTAIDAFRLIASRSGEYEGQEGPYWCDANGKWTRAWLTRAAPASCRVGIYRRGFRSAVWGIARFDAYAQFGGAGLWERMGDNQIAKCAEAQGLRKAFPEDLGSIYVREEMDQAGEELVGEVVDRDMNPDNRSKGVPANPTPPPAPSPPLLNAVDAVKETFSQAWAKVKTHAELDRLCFQVAKALGMDTPPEGQRWFEEMRAQTCAALGPRPAKGGAR